MKELIIIIGGCAIALYVLYKIGRGNAKEDNRKIYGTPIYADLCALEYFVINCTMNDTNKATITRRLQYYRARDEMEDVVFNCKVGDIAKIFEKRQNDKSEN